MYNAIFAKKRSLAEFRSWKWRVLQRRREFFIPQIAGFNLFLWCILSTILFKENISEVSLKGVVFSCSQASALLFLALIVTPRSKSILNGNTGYRICILLGLSLFPFLYTLKRYVALGLHFDYGSASISGAFVTALWITSIHHVGLTELISWTVSIAVILMWGIDLHNFGDPFNIMSLMSIIVGCLTIAFCNSLAEAEYKDMYALQNEAVEKNLNDVTFIDDIATILKQVGVLLQGIDKSNLLTVRDKHVHLSRVPYVSYLCLSLFGASTAQTAVDTENLELSARTDVELKKLCATAINKLENIRGRGCTLYYDPTSTELAINCKRRFLELIIMLLSEEAISATSVPSFCLISIQNVNNNIEIIIKKTSIESATPNAPKNRAGLAKPSSESSEAKESSPPLIKNLIADKGEIDAVFNNARFRLADRIARKHLKSKVDMTPSFSSHGLLHSNLRLVIPGPVSMTGSGSNTDEIVGETTMTHLNPWYVVEYYESNEDKMSNLKNQLDVLSIPWKPVHAYFFSGLRAKTQIVIVYEPWFRSHINKVFDEIIKLARGIIVVSSDSDAPKVFSYSPNEGPVTNIKISASITTKDLFFAIQSFVARLPPLSYRVPSTEAVLQPAHRNSSNANQMGVLRRQVSALSETGLESAPPSPSRPPPYFPDGKSNNDRNTDFEYLPILLPSEVSAEALLQDSFLIRRPDLHHLLNQSSNASRSRATSAVEDRDDPHFIVGGEPVWAEVNSGSFHRYSRKSDEFFEDEEITFLKGKWIDLLKRFECEAMEKKHNPSAMLLDIDDPSTNFQISQERVSFVYHSSWNLIHDAGAPRYDIIAREVVDLLQKLHTYHSENPLFPKLPYQQRISKLLADEIHTPLSQVACMIRDGKYASNPTQLHILSNKCKNIKFICLSMWLRVAELIAEYLVEFFPVSEAMLSDDRVAIDGKSPPTTPRTNSSQSGIGSGTSMSSNNTSKAAVGSGSGMTSSRSTAVIKELPSIPSVEIRKVLLKMLDLIQISFWGAVVNIIRLCDEDRDLQDSDEDEQEAPQLAHQSRR